MPHKLSLNQQTSRAAPCCIQHKIMPIPMLPGHCHKHLTRNKLARIMVKSLKAHIFPRIRETTTRSGYQMVKINHSQLLHLFAYYYKEYCTHTARGNASKQ